MRGCQTAVGVASGDTRGGEPGLDLSLRNHCFDVCTDATDVYNLAADMGGMGFIEANKASACCPCSSTRTCFSP